jgi:digeranylgeranylglycerophospholipid reductase
MFLAQRNARLRQTVLHAHGRGNTLSDDATYCILLLEELELVSTDQYDIVIAGAGPAGLSVAATAAGHGARVLVLEKRAEIGYPVKTGGGSFVQDLLALGVPADLFHPIHRIRLVSTNAEAVFPYEKPVFCVLDTRRLLQHLAREAAIAGARVLCGARVRGVQREGEKRWTISHVHCDGTPGRTAATMVVDATGVEAVVSQSTSLNRGFTRMGVGTEFEVLAPDADQSEALLMYGPRFAPSGYGWIFPLGDGRVRVGVGSIVPDSRTDTRALAWRLVEWLGSRHSGSDNWSVLEVHAGAVPAEGIRETFVGDGVIAVGDSAGHASCLAGEGIRYAMDAGQRAGVAAARFVETGMPTDLQDYGRKWLRDHAPMYRAAYKLNRRLSDLRETEWDESVRLSTQLSSDEFAMLLHGDFKKAGLSVLRTPIRASRLVGQARRLVGDKGTQNDSP